MPLNGEQRGYPICDADLWIKVCKINDVNLIFDEYPKTFMADAVCGEINKKAVDDPTQFEDSCMRFRKEIENGRIHTMQLSNKNMFDEKQRQVALRAFYIHKIFYDENKNQFKVFNKNLGEKVSAIYASIHGLAVVLSDDKGCGSFVEKHYRLLEVVRLEELLNKASYSKKEIQEFLAKANAKSDQELLNDRRSANKNTAFNSLKSQIKKSS